VLAVSGMHKDLTTCCALTYSAVNSVTFDGVVHRRDIAKRALDFLRYCKKICACLWQNVLSNEQFFSNVFLLVKAITAVVPYFADCKPQLTLFSFRVACKIKGGLHF